MHAAELVDYEAKGANNTRTSLTRNQPKSSYTILYSATRELFYINHLR